MLNSFPNTHYERDTYRYYLAPMSKYHFHYGIFVYRQWAWDMLFETFQLIFAPQSLLNLNQFWFFGILWENDSCIRMDSSFRWNDNDYVCVIPVKTGIHYKHEFSPLIPKEPTFIANSNFPYRIAGMTLFSLR